MMTASPLRDTLAAQLDAVRRRLAALDTPEGTMSDRDDADVGRHSVERDAITDERARLMTAATNLVLAIERAESGRYGVCDDCGAAIPAARLRALPATPHCLRCQERFERHAAATRTRVPRVMEDDA